MTAATWRPALAPAPGARGSAGLAQPGGRLRHRQARRARRRPRLDPAGRPAACRDRGAGRGRRARTRRHRLCHARALRPSRPDAALRRGADRRRHRAAWWSPSRTPTRASPAGASQLLRQAGIAVGRRAGARRRAELNAGFFTAHPRGPAAGHPEARDEPRRAHRHGIRREPMDHRRGGAPARASAARDATTPCWSAAARRSADDPQLTCRLPGLEGRSPVRVVIDPNLRLPPTAKLMREARRSRSG